MKIVSVLILLSIFSNIAFADCDWTKIKDNGDNTFTYSKELHLCVGSLVQDNKVKTEQLTKLNQALELKDLAITKSDQRVALWMDTSEKMQERISKAESLQSKNDFWYFGLGIASAVAAGWMASQLIRH
jgi:hypothetical protein